MSGERWEDMPDVGEASWARRALSPDEPVVPVRVLRQWIDEERQHAIVRANYAGSPATARIASKWVFDALSRVLDDYEKENPNANA